MWFLSDHIKWLPLCLPKKRKQSTTQRFFSSKRSNLLQTDEGVVADGKSVFKNRPHNRDTTFTFVLAANAIAAVFTAPGIFKFLQILKKYTSLDKKKVASLFENSLLSNPIIEFDEIKRTNCNKLHPKTCNLFKYCLSALIFGFMDI